MYRRVPGDGGEPLDDLTANVDKIRVALHDAFDRQRQVDLAVARYLAAHSPTERAELQTADIARMRGRESSSSHWQHGDETA